MALFAWSDEYAVGVPEIDRQHQQLFTYAGQLHSAMIAGQGWHLFRAGRLASWDLDAVAR